MKKENYPIGEISHGTLRSEDLIPCFLDVLNEFDPREANRIKREYKLALMFDDDFEMGDPLEDEARQAFEDDEPWIIEELHDALNDICAPFFYFGSHIGDGACFGFWISDDALQDAIQCGEAKQVDDLADVSNEDWIDFDYIVLVNDHGHVSLYENQNEIWAIV